MPESLTFPIKNGASNDRFGFNEKSLLELALARIFLLETGFIVFCLFPFPDLVYKQECYKRNMEVCYPP